jgi:hypothetical protein
MKIYCTYFKDDGDSLGGFTLCKDQDELIKRAYQQAEEKPGRTVYTLVSQDSFTAELTVKKNRPEAEKKTRKSRSDKGTRKAEVPLSIPGSDDKPLFDTTGV